METVKAEEASEGEGVAVGVPFPAGLGRLQMSQRVSLEPPIVIFCSFAHLVGVRGRSSGPARRMRLPRDREWLFVPGSPLSPSSILVVLRNRMHVQKLAVQQRTKRPILVPIQAWNKTGRGQADDETVWTL